MKKEIQILNIIWQIKYLGNQAILLETSAAIPLTIIHQITQFIRISKWQGVMDIVPAYQSIAIFYDKSIISIPKIIQKIQVENFSKTDFNLEIQTHKIPVCFEKGLDWNEVEDRTQIKKTDFIKQLIPARLYFFLSKTLTQKSVLNSRSEILEQFSALDEHDIYFSLKNCRP